MRLPARPSLKWGIWLMWEDRCRWRAAGAFGATLDEHWAELPSWEEVIRKLKEWGIYEEGMSEKKI